MNEPNHRFLDTGTRLDEFYDEFLVVCPKCAKMARVLVDEAALELMSKKKTEQFRNKMFAPRRLVCGNCAHSNHWTGTEISVGSGVDWYFRAPLWLQISCCGETLWAYNRDHLELLEQFVGAKLRERTNKGRNSFLSKLPQWIKSAKNREEILRAIARMRATL
jgi:hypothetical protein